MIVDISFGLKFGRESLIGFNFVIWKCQQLVEAPDVIN